MTHLNFIRHPKWQNSFLTKLLTFTCLGTLLSQQAFATQLPARLLSYLRQQNPQVQIRFDGMITYPNGESYLPVFPQDPAASEEPGKELRRIPETAAYPDVIQFDNNLFLLRLIPTSSGKMTLPRMADYPIQLKEGLLPQDLLLPANLSIPAELKIILGALPYNPQTGSEDTPTKLSALTPDQKLIRIPTKIFSQTLYLANLANQSLVAVDPDRGTEQGNIALNCVPSTLTASADEKLLFVPCLTTDELVVLDTEANLIKTRIPVGSKPANVLALNQMGKVLVSNRFSNFLSLVDVAELTTGEEIPLPTPGGVMAATTTQHVVYVADLASPDIYEVNLDIRNIQRVLKGLPSISALWISPTGQELWLASKATHQVQVISLITGKPLKTLDVGKKPVAFVAAGDRLYVVSSTEDRIDVIDWKEQLTLPSIALEAGSFPSGISLSADRDFAYVAAAGTEVIYEVGLKSGQVLRTLPVKVRGIALARIGGEKLVTPPVPDAPPLPKTATAPIKTTPVDNQPLAPLTDSFK